MSHSSAHHATLAAVTELLGAWDGIDEPLLDAGRSATAIETVGRTVADAVRALAPDTLLTWPDSSNAVLAHIVSRELGVPAAPFINEDGVIDIDSGLVRGRRVVLVVGHGLPPHQVRPLSAYVAAQQGMLAGITEVVGIPGSTADPAVPHIVVVNQAELAKPAGPVEVPSLGASRAH